MSGIAIVNLKLNPIPPSYIERHKAGMPDTSYAIKITSEYICLASKLASIK
jgi:hypothetical protein